MFHFMVDKTFKICSEEFLNEELDNIRNIESSNVYKVRSINKLINYYRKRKSKRNGQVLSEDYNKCDGNLLKLKGYSFPI